MGEAGTLGPQPLAQPDRLLISRFTLFQQSGGGGGGGRERRREKERDLHMSWRSTKLGTLLERATSEQTPGAPFFPTVARR